MLWSLSIHGVDAPVLYAAITFKADQAGAYNRFTSNLTSTLTGWVLADARVNVYERTRTRYYTWPSRHGKHTTYTAPGAEYLVTNEAD